MQYSKPLIEIIAELQKIADANPGIECTLNDHEWGPNSPKVKIAPVYVNDSEHVIIVEDFARFHMTQTAKEYSEQTAQEMWNSYGDDKGLWTSFEEFEESYMLVKENALKEVKEFDKAVMMVVFET